METVLVHKKNKNAKVIATDPIQQAAFETWGFVVSDGPVESDDPEKVEQDSSEVDELKKQLAKATKQLEKEAQARAKAEEATAKAQADADAALKTAEEAEAKATKDTNSKEKESK